MAISNLLNRQGLVSLLDGTIVWDTGGDVVKCQLMEDSYVPGAATFRDVHNFYDDVSGYNPTSALAMAVTLQAPQTAAGKVYLDPSTTSLTFTQVGGTEDVGGFVTFYSSGSAATSPLISLHAFSGGAVTANGSDIQVTFDANGFVKFSF
jgi:hypothetical protein